MSENKQPLAESRSEEKKTVKKDAFETAVKYLAVSPRSEKEVREKLYSKGFHRQEVEEAIERAKKYRYIDDESYTADFVDYYAGRYGRKKLEFKLTVEKGISPQLAKTVIEDKLSDEAELDKAVETAAKYAKTKRITERKDAKKVAAYLYQRGYDGGTISKAMSRVFDVSEFED